MKTFYFKVFDYIYTKRLELFQSLFYDLYRNFGGKYEELFRFWFETYTIKKALGYFPLEDVLKYYPQYALGKRNLILSYVKTYWNFCQRPALYPGKIKESMKFFGIETLTEKELKKAYRRLVKENHPDRLGDKKLAHKRMLLINYHHQILMSYIREARACSTGSA